MTTTVPPRFDQTHRNGAVATPKTPTLTAAPTPTQPARTSTTIARYTTVATRIGLGFIFLWAFLDKLFGLGFATPTDKGWLDGGNPTKGFLSGAEGPFAGLYHDLAGTAIANTLFMTGLAAIGTALLLGIGMRIAATTGALLMTMMYTVVLPPTTNPLIDDHLILAIVLIGLAATNAGNTLGLGRHWTNTTLVKHNPWLT